MSKNRDRLRIFSRISEALLTVLFLIIPSSLICSGDFSMHGGAARRASLGGVKIVLPDASAVIDLYEEGFASSLIFRKNRNMISMSWGAMPREYSEEKADFSDFLRDHPVFLAGEGDGSSGATVFFDGENALQLKPYLVFNSGEQNTVSGVFSDTAYADFHQTLYAADIIYSRKITESFSGGASLRAAFFEDAVAAEEYAYIAFDDAEISRSDKKHYSKVEYSVSGTYAFDEKMQAAASFGTLKALNPYFETWITKMNKPGFAGAINAYPALFCGYGYSRLYTEKTLASLWESSVESEEKQSVAGYDLDAGCSSSGQGQSVFSVSAGLTFAIAGNYSILSSTAVDMYFGSDTGFTGSSEYTGIKNGFGHHAALKGRYDFGQVIAAGEFAYSSAAADFYEAAGRAVSVNLQVLKAAFGFVFVPKGFNIPFEVFAGSLFQSEKGGQENRDANYALQNAGVKTGVECEISEKIFMRLGLDAAYGGTSSYVDKNGVISKMQLGTTKNPAFTQLAISLGAGHYTDQIEINLNLRYSNTGRLPYNPDLFKYNEWATTIMTDVKIYI